MERCPAPRACATRAFPIALVLSARRTVSAVGSRIWATWYSAQPARHHHTTGDPSDKPALRRRRSETEPEFRDPLKDPLRRYND